LFVCYCCWLLAVGFWPLAFCRLPTADCQLPTHNQPLDFGHVSGKFKKDATGKGLTYSVKSCEKRKLLRGGVLHNFETEMPILAQSW